MTGWPPAPARMAFRAFLSAWSGTAGMEPVAFPVARNARMAVRRPGGRNGAGTFFQLRFSTSLDR